MPSLLPNLIITGGVESTGKAITLFASGEQREFLSVPGGEVYGITSHADFRFLAVRGGWSGVLRVNSLFVVDRKVALPQADPHCIYVENAIVHLVSSSEDAIHKFDLDLNPVGSDVFGLGGDNRFHVNDVTRIGSKFFVSMFTDKADGKWNSEAPLGLVKTDTQISPSSMTWVISGLVKPHSPVLFKDDLWVADSGRGAVWCNSTKVFQEQGAWTRGLCMDGDYIHVGVSSEDRSSAAKVVTLTRSGDIVREVVLPLTYIYEIQKLC